MLIYLTCFVQLRYLPTPFDAVAVVEEKGPGVRFYHPRDLHQIAEMPTVSDEEVRAITEAKQAIAAGKFVAPTLLSGQGGGAVGGSGKRSANVLIVAPIVNCWDVSLDRGLVAVAQVRIAKREVLLRGSIYTLLSFQSNDMVALWSSPGLAHISQHRRAMQAAIRSQLLKVI